MNNPADTSEGRPVTRSRIRRLASADSDASSRPGTPLPASHQIKLSTVDELAGSQLNLTPARRTRRSSVVADTPKKTPLKRTKDYESSPRHTPKRSSPHSPHKLTDKSNVNQRIKNLRGYGIAEDSDVEIIAFDDPESVGNPAQNPPARMTRRGSVTAVTPKKKLTKTKTSETAPMRESSKSAISPAGQVKNEIAEESENGKKVASAKSLNNAAPDAVTNVTLFETPSKSKSAEPSPQGVAFKKAPSKSPIESESDKLKVKELAVRLKPLRGVKVVEESDVEVINLCDSPNPAETKKKKSPRGKRLDTIKSGDSTSSDSVQFAEDKNLNSIKTNESLKKTALSIQSIDQTATNGKSNDSTYQLSCFETISFSIQKLPQVEEKSMEDSDDKKISAASTESITFGNLTENNEITAPKQVYAKTPNPKKPTQDLKILDTSLELMDVDESVIDERFDNVDKSNSIFPAENPLPRTPSPDKVLRSGKIYGESPTNNGVSSPTQTRTSPRNLEANVIVENKNQTPSKSSTVVTSPSKMRTPGEEIIVKAPVATATLLLSPCGKSPAAKILTTTGEPNASSTNADKSLVSASPKNMTPSKSANSIPLVLPSVNFTVVEPAPLNSNTSTESMITVVEHTFAKSWSQSIVNNAEKIDTIHQIADKEKDESQLKDQVTTEKSTDKLSTPLQLHLQAGSDEYESEESDENEERECEQNDENADEIHNDEEAPELFDDMAVDVGKDYESGDSMDEEERQYIEEHEISDKAESIGSVDTIENETDNTEDNDIDSFIVDDNELELVAEFSDDDNNEDVDIKTIEKKFSDKKKTYQRLLVASSDSEDGVVVKVNENKKKTYQRLLVASSDSEEDYDDNAVNASATKQQNSTKIRSFVRKSVEQSVEPEEHIEAQVVKEQATEVEVSKDLNVESFKTTDHEPTIQTPKTHLVPVDENESKSLSKPSKDEEFPTTTVEVVDGQMRSKRARFSEIPNKAFMNRDEEAKDIRRKSLTAALLRSSNVKDVSCTQELSDGEKEAEEETSNQLETEIKQKPATVKLDTPKAVIKSSEAEESLNKILNENAIKSPLERKAEYQKMKDQSLCALAGLKLSQDVDEDNGEKTMATEHIDVDAQDTATVSQKNIIVDDQFKSKNTIVIYKNKQYGRHSLIPTMIMFDNDIVNHENSIVKLADADEPEAVQDHEKSAEELADNNGPQSIEPVEKSHNLKRARYSMSISGVENDSVDLPQRKKFKLDVTSRNIIHMPKAIEIDKTAHIVMRCNEILKVIEDTKKQNRKPKAKKTVKLAKPSPEDIPVFQLPEVPPKEKPVLKSKNTINQMEVNIGAKLVESGKKIPVAILNPELQQQMASTSNTTSRKRKHADVNNKSEKRSTGNNKVFIFKSSAGTVVETPAFEYIKTAAGAVCVEPITPPRKPNRNGFRESPLTPRMPGRQMEPNLFKFTASERAENFKKIAMGRKNKRRR